MPALGRHIATGALLASGLLFLSSCGGAIRARSDEGGDAYDPRESRVECLREEGLPAREVDGIAIDVGRAGVRVVFAKTPGEAENRLLRGQAQGAEQIGRALLYPAAGDDALLDVVEECVEED